MFKLLFFFYHVLRQTYESLIDFRGTIPSRFEIEK
jgi:hypothetical protein